MRRDILWLLALVALLAGGFWLFSRPKDGTPPPALSPPSASTAPTAPTPDGLPDLVVTEVYWDPPYVRVHYRNDGGLLAPDEGDFLIRVASGGKEFDGNSIYRYPIPLSGREIATGGFTIGLIGLEEGTTADVTATIDWEGRVRELDETNNQLTRRITLGGPALVKPAPDYHTADPQASPSPPE